MKFQEKRKKNKNCEISHIVRPAVTPEVYNQKQNTLFIFECVEHRIFKVTWERLCAYSNVCTVECTFRARGSADRDARLGQACISAVRDARLGRAHSSDECSARLFVVHNLDAYTVRLRTA